jgi:hypothetical protein
MGASDSDGKPDFSGNWTLNLDKSKFGKAEKPNGMTLKVTRDGDVTHAVQTTNTPGGPVDSETNWVLDGKEHDIAGPAPSRVLTRWDGNSLYSERKANDGSLDEKIWLMLSSDGKTAIEKVVTKTPEGSNVSILVWERH